MQWIQLPDTWQNDRKGVSIWSYHSAHSKDPISREPIGIQLSREASANGYVPQSFFLWDPKAFLLIVFALPSLASVEYVPHVCILERCPTGLPGTIEVFQCKCYQFTEETGWFNEERCQQVNKYGNLGESFMDFSSSPIACWLLCFDLGDFYTPANRFY